MGSSSGYVPEILEEARMIEENVRSVQMVNDAYRKIIYSFSEDENRGEKPNLEAKRFFDMFDASKNLGYGSCREGHSLLSAATKMMNIKTDFKFLEDCVDVWTDFVKVILPEDNLLPSFYYEIEKLGTLLIDLNLNSMEKSDAQPVELHRSQLYEESGDYFVGNPILY